MDLSTKVLNNYPNFKGASKKIADLFIGSSKDFFTRRCTRLGKNY